MSIIRGVVPPVLTPFHDDGSLDLESLDRLVDHLLEAGVHGLFALGSSGQVAYLTDAERDTVIARIAERTAKRVPILVGTPDMSALRSAEQARRAVANGADAIVATAPVYAINDADEIGRGFRTLAEAAGVPVFAYDVPVRVHTKLGLDLVMELAKDGVLAGLKDSSGNDVAFRRLVMANEAAGHPLSVLTGHEVVVDGMLLLGADGVVPGLGNVDPAGYVRMWDAAQAGDWAAVKAEQDRLARLFEIVFVAQGRSGDAGGLGAFKVAMHALGVFESASMRDPIERFSQFDGVTIRGILSEVGLG